MDLNYESIPCARCEAKVNEHCVTVTGKRCAYHAARVTPLGDAYLQGYHAGYEDRLPRG